MAKQFFNPILDLLALGAQIFQFFRKRFELLVSRRKPGTSLIQFRLARIAFRPGRRELFIEPLILAAKRG